MVVGWVGRLIFLFFIFLKSVDLHFNTLKTTRTEKYKLRFSYKIFERNLNGELQIKNES